MPILLACTGISTLALIIMLWAGHNDHGTLAKVMKMTASTGFIALAVAAGGFSSPYGRIILLALFFSWWGDFFLMWRGMFLYGLIAFFIGHLFYVIAFLHHGQKIPWTLGGAIAMVVFAIPVFIWLNPHLADNPMKFPVYAYMTIITLMVIFSIGAVGQGAVPWVVAAALLFYVSDIFVARATFVQPGEINRLIGLPLYYGGQVLFAWTIVWMNAIEGR